MPAETRPDLFAFMDAYKALGVDYAADSSAIRVAYRRLTRLHHPDRHPAGSPEQQRATARMAEINDAYRLVREAPLRYHRVSRASDPDRPWTEDELSEALRQAKLNRTIDLGMTVGSVVVAVIIVPLFVSSLMPAVMHAGPLQGPLTIALILGSTFVMYEILGPRMWQTLLVIQLALGGLRVVQSYFVKS
jgi:hypothetical protein